MEDRYKANREKIAKRIAEAREAEQLDIDDATPTLHDPQTQEAIDAVRPTEEDKLKSKGTLLAGVMRQTGANFRVRPGFEKDIGRVGGPLVGYCIRCHAELGTCGCHAQQA
jgi:hypothetical protein